MTQVRIDRRGESTELKRGTMDELEVQSHFTKYLNGSNKI